MDNLVVDPTVTWMDSEGNTRNSGTGTTLDLTFDPLRTSDGGEYTCRASITIDEISITDLSDDETQSITVQSEYTYCTTTCVCTSEGMVVCLWCTLSVYVCAHQLFFSSKRELLTRNLPK